MPRALSGDLRQRVIETIEAGASCGVAAERFGIGRSTVIAWHERYRRTGEVEAVKVGGDKRSGRIEAHADFLLALVEERPDATLAEMRERLITERDERFGIGTLWRFFDRRGVTFKKRPRTLPSRIVPTS